MDAIGDAEHALRPRAGYVTTTNVIDSIYHSMEAALVKRGAPLKLCNGILKSAPRARREAFYEAALRHALQIERFNVDGWLLGADDCIIDSSSGRPEARPYDPDDHVSMSIGFDAKNFRSNADTPEYREFKTKILRVFRDPGVCEWAMRVLAQLTFDGDTVFGQRHTEFVCAERGSGKTLLFKMTLAMLGQYAGVINYSELTSHMQSGSTDYNSFAMHIAFRRLIVADEGDENVGTQRARPVCWTRLKAIQGNAPKKARLAGKNQYKTVETGFVGLIAVLCNPSNMTEQPTDEMVPTLSLLNDECLAQFGDVDDPDNYRFLKDETFLRDSVIRSNRLHMLTLLSEYYDPAFNVMSNMPDMLIHIRNNWDIERPPVVEGDVPEVEETVDDTSNDAAVVQVDGELVNAITNMIAKDTACYIKRVEFLDKFMETYPAIWARIGGDDPETFNASTGVSSRLWERILNACQRVPGGVHWKIRAHKGMWYAQGSEMGIAYGRGFKLEGWHLPEWRLA